MNSSQGAPVQTGAALGYSFCRGRGEVAQKSKELYLAKVLGPHFSPIFEARGVRRRAMLGFSRFERRSRSLRYVESGELRKARQGAASHGPRPEIGEKCGLAIDVSAITNSDNRDQQVATLVRVDYAVSSDSKTAKTFPSSTQCFSLFGIVTEAINSLDDPQAVLFRESGYLFDSTPLPTDSDLSQAQVLCGFRRVQPIRRRDRGIGSERVRDPHIH